MGGWNGFLGESSWGKTLSGSWALGIPSTGSRLYIGTDATPTGFLAPIPPHMGEGWGPVEGTMAPPTPSRPRWGREVAGIDLTVFALAFARMGDAIGNSILIIVIPLMIVQLPSPLLPIPEPERVGVLIALYGFLAAFVQPIGGALIDRTNRHKIFILIGLATMAVSTSGFSFATTFLDLLALRALQGIGFALTIPASVAIVTIVTQKTTRGESMGIYNSSRFLGFTVGSLIGGFLYTTYGPDIAFYTGTGFIVLAIILVQAFVQEIEVPDEETVPAENKVKRRSPFSLPGSDFISSGIGGLGFAVFLMASAFAMLVTLEPQFNIRLHETAFAFSIAFATLSATQVALQYPIGRISDRWGRKPFVVAGLLIIAPAIAGLGFIHTTTQLIGLRLLQGIGTAAVAAPAFALAGDLSKRATQGRQLSVVTTGFGLGLALGPLIAGFLIPYGFEVPFLLGAALSVFGAWVVYRYVPETVERESGDRPSRRPFSRKK